VQVDVFHRNDLGVTTTGGTTLDAEDRAEGWLAKCDHRALTDLAKTVTKTNRGGGLTLTGRGGADRRHEDQVRVLLLGQGVQVIEADLGLVVAVGINCFVGQVKALGDL